MVALTFLISEWAGFLQSARRFKSYDHFRNEGHEGWKPIFSDFPHAYGICRSKIGSNLGSSYRNILFLIPTCT